MSKLFSLMGSELGLGSSLREIQLGPRRPKCNMASMNRPSWGLYDSRPKHLTIKNNELSQTNNLLNMKNNIL